ncbi:aminoglycoside phosphotransferase [Paenibacillus alvei TS-15]|jgi:Ser/Thr protein kinase RdoA (MazF antagonist)|uniref:Aminoglycoside phosphotransferase n=1 Tax=Paenibacillus alvei TS-15 TaxID=1117108 RepID=S9SMG5_PAEAL|nr:phosphotransferase [Paenibacillus alvei]EPY05268.1 aminoglycoside phosphotransferase [Paenibacillus alvei TS-15]
MERNANTYGLIHGDLHTGNVVYNGEEPRPIDFGRCGYGYYLYDMAGALLGLGVKQREQFITGYESNFSLERARGMRSEILFCLTFPICTGMVVYYSLQCVLTNCWTKYLG